MSGHVFAQRLANIFLTKDNPAEVDVEQAGLPDSASRHVAHACQFMLVMRNELDHKEDGPALFMRLALQSYEMLEGEVQKVFNTLESGKAVSVELDNFISLLDGSLDMERECDFSKLPYEHRLLAITTTARFILKYGLRHLNSDELAEMIEDLNQNMLAIDMEGQMMADMTPQSDDESVIPLKQYLNRLHNVVTLGLKEELINLKQAGI